MNQDPLRFVNKRLHLCGCVTVFDTEPWRSIALHRCQDHAPLDPDWRP